MGVIRGKNAGDAPYVSLREWAEAQIEHTELNGFSTAHIGKVVTINLTDKKTGEWQAFLTGKLLGWSANPYRLTPYLEGGIPADSWFDPSRFRAEVKVLR